jgi:hypothetical protein
LLLRDLRSISAERDCVSVRRAEGHLFLVAEC